MIASGRSRAAAAGGRRGYALAQVLLILATLTALIVAAAEWGQTRERSAHASYVAATAQALAESGVQAGIAARAAGAQPAARPLGEEIPLTGAVGSLELRLREAEGRLVFESCAVVRSTALRGPTATRCVDGSLNTASPVRVLSWAERSHR